MWKDTWKDVCERKGKSQRWVWQKTVVYGPAILTLLMRWFADSPIPGRNVHPKGVGRE